MNSNGIRLAEDPDLCRRLAELGVYVILSLNTLDPEVSRRLHGRDLSAVKRRAIENLARAGVRMTLLYVLIRDVNEDALADLLELMRQYDHVLSLTVQTMTYTGQGGGQFPRLQAHSRRRGGANRLPPIGRVARAERLHRPAVRPSVVLPVCYLLKSGRIPAAAVHAFRPAGRRSGDCWPIRTCFGPHIAEDFFTDAINELYADGQTDHLATLRGLVERLYPPGRAIDDFQRQRLAEQSVRTIYLHAHMDEDTFDCSRAMLCPDLVPAEPGRWIPACTYNLFYRMKDERFYVDLPSPIRKGSRGLRAAGPAIAASREPHPTLALTLALSQRARGQIERRRHENARHYTFRL